MDWETLGRRLIHAGGAVVPLAYLVDSTFLAGAYFPWPRLQVVYLAGSLLAVALEFFRLGVGVEWWVYRRLTREYEHSNPAGYALYTVGSTVAVLAFAPRIAIPAVLALAVVDPISGLLARRGHRQIKRPRVLAVTFLLSLALGAWFVPLPAATLGAIAVTVADGVKPTIGGYVLDDNFTIPVGASTAIWLGVEVLPTSTILA